jgi:hypothetical protein
LDLSAGRGAIVEAAVDRVDAANDGKLVYLTGAAKADETLTDEQFGVAAPGIQLRRTAEMYQWRENQETKTEKKFGGGERTTTTYDYERVWSSSPINSESFNEQGRAAHTNPQEMLVSGRTTAAKVVTLGAYKLSPSLVGQITAYTDVPLTDEMAATASQAFNRTIARRDGWLYIGNDPGSPKIGDIRVKFSAVPSPQTVSLFAAQNGDSFAAWKAPTGRMLEQSLSLGTVTPDEMFAAKESQQAMLTWIVRGVGCVVMVLGVSMVLRPLSVLADVIPFLGDLVGVGTGIVALLVALPLAFTTIAVAWLFYRPLIGVPLVILSIGGIVWLCMLVKKRRTQRTVAEPT